MVMIVIAVSVLVLVVPHLMAVPVCLVTITVSIAVASYLPVFVPAVIPVMIVAYDALISQRAAVVPVSIAIVISVAEAVIIAVAEPRIIAEARFVRPPPLPVFALPLTAQAVVLDVVVTPLRQPLPVSIVIVGASIIWAAAIRTGAVPVLSAPGKS